MVLSAHYSNTAYTFTFNVIIRDLHSAYILAKLSHMSDIFLFLPNMINIKNITSQSDGTIFYEPPY